MTTLADATGAPAHLVDTHCHPYLMEVEPASTLELAHQAGVKSFVAVGIDPGSSLACLELARGFPGVVATAGLHPHEAENLNPRSRLDVEKLLADPLVVGVGEAGLDFFRMRAPVEAQETAFRWQLALARETGKAIVVHVRDAWERALVMMADEPDATVVLHCFSGGEAIARECAARGYFLSFAGPITYPKNGNLRAAAAAVPLDRLLTETDSPYLPPQSMRGRANVPANVVAVAETIAEVRDESLETVVRATFDNAKRAFPGLR